MERLTEYDEFSNAEFVGIDNTKLYERLVCDETVALTIATNKLAEFEDFMEKQEFEDLQSLKDTLYQTNMELYSMIKLQKENQALKDRWQKLKSFIEDKNIMLTYFDLLDKMKELEIKE